MRRWLVLVLGFFIAGSAWAATAPTANRLNLQGKGALMGDGAVQPRTGGDDIGSATVVPALPFSDTGATCGFVNDYDEVCPYTGSTSPDVVYSYTPPANEEFGVDLCASSYDTKVYIYEGGAGNLIACNDDAGCGYSGWQSRILDAQLTAGVTYYIVVDGYGGACGTYVIDFGAIGPPCEPCEAGAPQEGEPPCTDNYEDHYNGGCNSVPPVFQPLVAQDQQGCADLCGMSCTYLYQGLSYRDTDWFDVIGTGVPVEASCMALFPLQFIFIYNADCNNLQYDLVAGGTCQTVSLSHTMGEGVHAWLWVGPQVFTGVFETSYLLHACGIAAEPVVPAEEMSWGRLKSLQR